MATCDEYLEMLSASLDGELDSDGEDRLRADENRGCAAGEAFRSVSRELRQLDEVPEGFAASVMERIAAGEAPRAVKKPLWKRYTAAAACLVLICAAAIGLSPDKEAIASTMGDIETAAPSVSAADADGDAVVRAELFASKSDSVTPAYIDGVVFDAGYAGGAVIYSQDSEFHPSDADAAELLALLEYLDSAEAPADGPDYEIALAGGSVIDLWLSGGEAVCSLDGTAYVPAGSTEEIQDIIEDIMN